ncbi:MAG TPA: hypothetical protein VHT73_09120 [Thermodesulfobacteriota bacterium]|nr:hypothetical protein [Thermodesulfobacteriota bacterium]
MKQRNSETRDNKLQIRRRIIQQVEAKVEKKGRNLIVYPQECPLSLSICSWKKRGSKGWEDIEYCYAYAGHKDTVVNCGWRETFSKATSKNAKKSKKTVKPKTKRKHHG